jgi:glycosyltransferase involved in cell wall biosynthesis
MDRFCFYSRDLDRCRRCLSQSAGLAAHDQSEHRALARRLLASAAGAIFPSPFLAGEHRKLFSLPGLRWAVVEPGVVADRPVREARTGVAYAGSVQRHKGGHLLPEVARTLATRRIGLHVFGGGESDLLEALRECPNVAIHGYYRAGELPSLLARHGVGLVVLPSIVPEAYGLTLSEVWLAGASAVAFDLGATADRIRREGGGRLVPLESGAAGLGGMVIEIVERRREIAAAPTIVWRAADAARAHASLYRQWGLLPSP